MVLLIIMNSHIILKIVWIMISWILQKLAILDLHCFGFILFSKEFVYDFNTGSSLADELGKIETKRFVFHLSRGMRFPWHEMWYVRPAKAQTSLRIRPG